MRILITGACGFVGSVLARSLRERLAGWHVLGLDNFSRPGSESNRRALESLGVELRHADLRNASDLEALPDVDWVIDAAANPSVLAGTDGRSSSRQVLEHNLYSTVNLLEYCRARRCGFTLLSTSRVYSIAVLSQLQTEVHANAFRLSGSALPRGVSTRGVSEKCSKEAPISLYGSTKLASENLALEYHYSFELPVWIVRCGVLAGAGQFGRADQGIYSYWINSYLRQRPLNYVGFGGTGYQVRDCLHPRDLIPLLTDQMSYAGNERPRVVNAAGGCENAISLAQLSDWCAGRFGHREIGGQPVTRANDVSWLVLDSQLAADHWNWQPQTPLLSVLDEIACHAEQHPEWLELSGA